MKYADIRLIALLASLEKSYFFAKGSVPALSKSGSIVTSFCWNRRVGEETYLSYDRNFAIEELLFTTLKVFFIIGIELWFSKGSCIDYMTKFDYFPKLLE
jgi:hypothetical protein